MTKSERDRIDAYINQDLTKDFPQFEIMITDIQSIMRKYVNLEPLEKDWIFGGKLTINTNIKGRLFQYRKSLLTIIEDATFTRFQTKPNRITAITGRRYHAELALMLIASAEDIFNHEMHRCCTNASAQEMRAWKTNRAKDLEQNIHSLFLSPEVFHEMMW
jgi:hypothetical protein